MKEFFEGVILPGDDPKNEGRYLVYIPELQPFDKSKIKPAKNTYNGLWCYNRISNYCAYTDTELRDFDKKNSYGYWVPLKPGTQVVVMFEKGIYITGDIIYIISKDKPPKNQRDDFYLLMTTDKASWCFIDEKNGVLGASLHEKKSNVWMNDTEIQISKENGTVVQVHDEKITLFHHSGSFIFIDGNEISAKIKGAEIKMDGQNIGIKAVGNIDIKAGGEFHLEAGGLMSQTAAQIIQQMSIPANPQSPSNQSDVAKPSLDYMKDLNKGDQDEHQKLENL